MSFTSIVLSCSLKHTALVLEEHQAALRKKLQLKQEEYQAKRYTLPCSFMPGVSNDTCVNSQSATTVNGNVCTCMYGQKRSL